MSRIFEKKREISPIRPVFVSKGSEWGESVFAKMPAALVKLFKMEVWALAQIELSGITKIYSAAQRPQGRFGVLRGLFSREKREIRTLEDVSFSIGRGVPKALGFLALPAGAVFRSLSLLVWKIGVRRYQSTGS